MPWRFFWAGGNGGPDKTKSSDNVNDMIEPSIGSNATTTSSFPPSSSSSPKRYTQTQLIAFSLLSTALALGSTRLYKSHLRRIPSIAHLKPTDFRSKRTLYGYVTRVGDGDNFHIFHTPGGRLTGWGWLRNPPDKSLLKGATLHVRIAGIDAPEMAHFGRPEQPFGKEALEWLRKRVLHSHVRVRPWRRDQYERVVCTVYARRRWWGVGPREDLGLEMIRRGLATVYEAKFGSEFGGKEKEAAYRAAEKEAKRRQVGMWTKYGLFGKLMGKKETVESPREYKTRVATQEGIEGDKKS